MTRRRDILISTLLVGIQVGLVAALIGQSGLGQPGPTTSATVPALPPDIALRSRLLSLLPAPSTSAQLMQVQPRVSVIDFQQRVVQSGGDLKALANVLLQAQQGNIPAYDERLGITRSEFQRYLVFRNTLEPSGRTIRMALSREGNRLTFGDASGASILKGLSIDLQSGELSTQDGFTARPKTVQVTASQDRTGMGTSSGLSWDIRGSNPQTFHAINGYLKLLQFSGGQVLLGYYRVILVHSSPSEDSIYLLYRK